VNGSIDWSIVLDVGVGLGVLLGGIGVLCGMLGLARTLARLNKTLDEVDRQLATVAQPAGEAIGHLNAIAGSADQTVSKVSGAAALVVDALSPAVVNLGATLAGISAGLRRLFSGRTSADES
jgi:ABC-type transporter Mla subunit MlaD